MLYGGGGFAISILLNKSFLLFPVTNIVVLYHDDYDYYYVCVLCYLFWTTYLDFLNLSYLGSTIIQLPRSTYLL